MTRHSFWRTSATAIAALLVSIAAPMAPAGARTVVPGVPTAIAQQDERFAAAFGTVDAWVARGAFPGAVLAVGQRGRVVALKAFGRMAKAPGAPPMPVDAIFDLASLTKVVGTTEAAAILVDRGQLDLDAPVARYLPAFGTAPDHRAITVRELLVHASGLKPPATPLWQIAHDRRGILALIDTMPVSPAPGTAYHYRDENMILMGEIVARITGEPLDRFLRRNLFAPLGMRDTLYRPPAALVPRIPPTEQDDVLRHRLLRGVVHDENAFLMGGVSGHAGLFSDASDLARLAQMYLNGGTFDGRRLLSRRTIDLFRAPQNIPPGSDRRLGWDSPRKDGGFAGPLASPDAIMHTGFTGTSLYIDPARDAFVILLTNRVNPTRANELILQARPSIHTAVLKALDAG